MGDMQQQLQQHKQPLPSTASRPSHPSLPPPFMPATSPSGLAAMFVHNPRQWARAWSSRSVRELWRDCEQHLKVRSFN